MQFLQLARLREIRHDVAHTDGPRFTRVFARVDRSAEQMQRRELGIGLVAHGVDHRIAHDIRFKVSAVDDRPGFVA
jgi:hypothetical protein